MIGWAIAVFGWVLFWLVQDLIENEDILDRYNITINGWLSVLLWVYVLSGIINLIIYIRN